MMQITFPDGAKKEYQEGIKPIEIIKKDIGEGLARAALAVKINGKLADLDTPIKEACSFKVITFKDEEGVEIFRHSTAHILAHAVAQLFPKVKPTIGPVVEEGFYYDFDADPFKPEDLKKIEEKMHNIVNQDLPFERIELTKTEAQKLFKNNPYKLELIEEFGKDLTAYRQGDFIDLCRGPHVPSTGRIKAFKLTKIAGAYWRGDAKNAQLQRIYGISFPDAKELNARIKLMEEAEKRDHRKLGRDMELFMTHDLSLAGCPFFLPKGTIIYNKLLEFIRQEYFKRDYQEVITPQIFKKELWQTSGHWDHYKENMFTMTINGHEYSLKPMNCPSHLLIYKSKVRSYKDLPLRIADFCCIHRNELGGVLGGLTRVVKFCQDDAHIFLAMEQIEDEIKNLIDFMKYIYEDTFKFPYRIKLSTRPESFMGDKKLWDDAEKSLANALDKAGAKYEIKKGEGAFYGPKIDFDVRDSLGRDFQLATIQLDFQLPLRFEATYEGKDGKKHSVVMIHRALLGSLERFIGLLIEHYAGKFPLWISPKQIVILTVADRFNDYALELKKKFDENNFRVDLDLRAESVPKKVRDAQVDQIPLIITVGEREVKDKTVSVRTLDGKLADLKVDDFIKKVKENIEKKEISVKF